MVEIQKEIPDKFSSNTLKCFQFMTVDSEPKKAQVLQRILRLLRSLDTKEDKQVKMKELIESLVSRFEIDSK